MTGSPPIDLKFWVNQLIISRAELGGFSICPYAHSAKFKIIQVYDQIEIPNEEFEVVIFLLPDYLKYDELVNIANYQNKLHPLLVFLPDHKDRKTTINGIQTNNGKYNLLLCQPREKLQNAREKLKNTNYYSFWDKEYLDEILNNY